MVLTVEMPKLGNTVEECLIARWLKQEGQTVSAGETVVEIETDKTSSEVAVPLDGMVLATFFEQGALVPVFTPLFVIGNPGESVEAFCPRLQKSTSTSDSAAPLATKESENQTLGTTEAPAHFAAPWSTRARRFAEERNFFSAGGERVRAWCAGSGSRPAHPLSHVSTSLGRGDQTRARRGRSPV